MVYTTTNIQPKFAPPKENVVSTQQDDREEKEEQLVDLEIPKNIPIDQDKGKINKIYERSLIITTSYTLNRFLFDYASALCLSKKIN